MASDRPAAPWHLVGVMSGTSLDGADAVIVETAGHRLTVLGHAHRPFTAELRQRLFALQSVRAHELDLAAVAANQLAEHYAMLVTTLLDASAVSCEAIRAVAVHGQTVRHRPELGYTIQLNAPARIAELLGIDVICDFRARDVAAGGQGAPLVPAFHAALFGDRLEHRAIINLGGMANVSDLPPGVADDDGPLRGWDTGPGNVYLDAWYSGIQGDVTAFDRDGAFAATGRVDGRLLERLLEDPWFLEAPPKSTGRDHFSTTWLAARLGDTREFRPEDVQATLAELTAQTVAATLAREVPRVARIVLAGGGARNGDLAHRIGRAIEARLSRAIAVVSSETLGILPEHVEAAAFAWLGARFLERRPGNRPGVTGARGPRILGALYPA